MRVTTFCRVIKINTIGARHLFTCIRLSDKSYFVYPDPQKYGNFWKTTDKTSMEPHDVTLNMLARVVLTTSGEEGSLRHVYSIHRCTGIDILQLRRRFNK